MDINAIALEMHKLGKRENSLLLLLEAMTLAPDVAELVAKLRLVQRKRCTFLVDLVPGSGLSPLTAETVIEPK